MSDTKKEPHELVNLTINELKKVISDLKEGKDPTMPPSMEKLAEEIQQKTNERKNMTDEQIKQWADHIASEVSKLNNN